MNKSDRLYKLSQGSDTAVWAHDEIVSQDKRIAELQGELQSLKKPILQMVVSKFVLLNEPNVLTGYYRMQIMDDSWQVWTPIPHVLNSLNEQKND
jgi:hypothetical protein